jgi:hypothetical protein
LTNIKHPNRFQRLVDLPIETTKALMGMNSFSLSHSGNGKKPSFLGKEFSLMSMLPQGLKGPGAKDSKKGFDGLFTWPLESLNPKPSALAEGS